MITNFILASIQCQSLLISVYMHTECVACYAVPSDGPEVNPVPMLFMRHSAYEMHTLSSYTGHVHSATQLYLHVYYFFEHFSAGDSESWSMLMVNFVIITHQ